MANSSSNANGNYAILIRKFTLALLDIIYIGAMKQCIQSREHGQTVLIWCKEVGILTSMAKSMILV